MGAPAVESMVRWTTDAGADHTARLAARGPDHVVLDDADLGPLLAQSQPDLSWVSTAPYTLAYGAFAELVLHFAILDNDVHAAMRVATHMLGTVGLSRLWSSILLGMGDDSWSPCSKGVFLGRLSRAALSAAIPADALKLRTADFYIIPIPIHYVFM